jgi:hypothetical protein
MEGPAFFGNFKLCIILYLVLQVCRLWFQHRSNYHSNLEFVFLLFFCSNLLHAVYMFRSNICHSPLFLFNLKKVNSCWLIYNLVLFSAIVASSVAEPCHFA